MEYRSTAADTQTTIIKVRSTLACKQSLVTLERGESRVHIDSASKKYLLRVRDRGEETKK